MPEINDALREKSNQLLEDYDEILTAIADAVYDARKAFFADNLEDYVKNTFFDRKHNVYYCWPIIDTETGKLSGFDELLPNEREALTPLSKRGFQVVDVGAGRVVLSTPIDSLVVKIARYGVTSDFGDGRPQILIEAGIYVNHGDDLPVLPCIYWSPRGRFAVYPEVNVLQGGSTAEANPERIDTIRATVEAAPVDLLTEELTRPANLGKWNGDLYVIDYTASGTPVQPYGVPAYRCQAVIQEVDQLRSAGEKPDIE